MNSATTSAGATAAATQYNNLRKDLITMAGDYAATTGSANAYILALDAQLIAYTNGLEIRFKANFSNTAGATINVNSIGAVSIYDNGSSSLASNRIVINQVYVLVYNTSLGGFELQTAGSNTPVDAFELDGNGDYQPITGTPNDPSYDLDSNSDVQPANRIYYSAGGEMVMADGDQLGSLVSSEEVIKSSYTYYLDTGLVNALVVTMAPAPTSYTNGMEVSCKVLVTNTGAVTINVNGLGAKSIVKGLSTALIAGDLPAGLIIMVKYDGVNFQLQSQPGTNNLDYLTHYSTCFETAGRFLASTFGTASNTFNTTGLFQNVTAVSSAAVELLGTAAATNILIFNRDMVMGTVCNIALFQVNAIGASFFGVFDNAAFGTNVAYQTLTQTARHVGVRLESSSTQNTFTGTCADGTTQATIDMTTAANTAGWLPGTDNAYICIVKTSVAIKFYLNGTYLNQLTNNIPTGGANNALLRFSAHTPAAGGVGVSTTWAAASLALR